MRIFIWGTGNVATRYLAQGEIEAKNILGFIETSKNKDFFRDKKVYAPREVAQRHDYDYILVCIFYYSREIYDLCKSIGIDTNKLIFADNWEWSNGTGLEENMICCRPIKEGCDDNVVAAFPKFHQTLVDERNIQAQRYIAVLRNGYDLQEKNALIWQKEFLAREYQTDYFRYRTFELMANEIIRKKINGSVAEVGVFKGTFAKMINAKFPKKKLYLFDIFESFDENEFQQELAQGRCPDEFLDVFKNTCVEKVLSIMPYPEKCIVKKGLFPSTALGMEDKRYAFVSIDVDFENSILEALRYFYPRLNIGGAMFVHDYNNRFLGGVRKAIETYEKEELGGGILSVPLADEGGTLVIVK